MDKYLEGIWWIIWKLDTNENCGDWMKGKINTFWNVGKE
jgi:hypothetical protein